MEVKERTLKELYQILYKECDKNVLKFGGICSVMFDLHIGYFTTDEYHRLYRHFKTQRPSNILHKDFYYPIVNKDYSAFWWVCEEQIQIEGEYVYEKKAPALVRSKFLRYLIKTL